MSTSILTQVFIPGSLQGLGNIVDIVTTQGTFSGTTGYGATFPLAALIPNITISGEDGCFFPTVNAPATTATTLPTNADPPFPPVWPYLFSTGDVYGRDHLSVNLKMVRGDTFAFDIAIILNGAAVNIAGGTLKMTAKWDIMDADIAAQFVKSTPSTGIVITSATGGLATVTLSPIDTSTLPAHQVNLVYDIQLTDVSNNVYTVLSGILAVYPDSTITVP